MKRVAAGYKVNSIAKPKDRSKKGRKEEKQNRQAVPK